MKRARILTCVSLLLCAACERKLPGPDECRTFALETVRSRLPSPHVPMDVLQEEVETLTQECLTLPYDRRTLHCAKVTGQPRACVREMQRRRALKAAREDL